MIVDRGSFIDHVVLFIFISASVHWLGVMKFIFVRGCIIFSLPVFIWLSSNTVFKTCSVKVFGVSAKSMQCSYDDRGNSVPTILLTMQKQLYSEGGLKVCSFYLGIICENHIYDLILITSYI